MTARRTRYYVIRFLYGVVILLQIYLTYDSNRRFYSYGSRPMSTKEMADFGLTIFAVFAMVQAVVVLLLTPALVAGTIADERQRKTLHYLLTSQLSGVEIVLSKLGARLLHILVLIALGLPVISLLGLFGGIDFNILLLTYAATFTTVYFLATLSILVSVGSRRPREAISLVYILELCWLFAPVIFLNSMNFWPEPWPTIFPWVEPVLNHLANTSPMYLLGPRSWRTMASVYETLFWGMGLQVLYGTIFVVIAAMRLRPSFRNEGGGRLSRMFAWTKGINRRRRWFPRPACGDDAMLWKERYVSRAGGLSKVAMFILGLALGGVLGYSSYLYGLTALAEMWDQGYFAGGQMRSSFNMFIRTSCTALYVLWMLAVAASSASGLSSEREEDTWISLTATPMGGDEIIRAKMFGPVWALRPIAFMIFALWGLGLLVGSITPWGLAASLVEFVVFTWFLTALGTYFSLKAKNSTRSLATTIGLLIFFNGGYAACCAPLRIDSPAIIFGCTPAVFAVSMMGYQDFTSYNNRYNGDWVVAGILSLGAYGIAAACLMTSAIRIFDTVVDRPDRFRQRLTAGQAHAMVASRKPPGMVDELL